MLRKNGKQVAVERTRWKIVLNRVFYVPIPTDLYASDQDERFHLKVISP
jgi:hypothetical protein